MGKSFSSVMEMIEELSDDESFVQEFKNTCAKKHFSSILFQMRNLKNLDEASLAERLGVSPSQISKIEDATSDKLSLFTFFSFVVACGFEVNMHIHQPRNLSEEVRFYSSELKKVLQKLVDLTHSDTDIETAVSKFVSETELDRIIELAAQLTVSEPNEKKEKTLQVRMLNSEFEYSAADLMIGRSNPI